MDCLSSVVKYIMYIFNLIFVVIGILLIVLGSLMISNIGDFSDFNGAVNTNTIPILLIVLGCIVFVISFFGCCGMIKDNSCCTMTYAIFMFILFALQLALIIWIWVKRQQFLDTMGDVVDQAWEKNDQANGYPMEALELSMKCCGRQSYLDYTNAGLQVPSSCCGTRTGDCPQVQYQLVQGCRVKFVDFWASNMDIIRWAGLGVALFELIVFSFACCLAGKMRRQQ